MFDEVENPGRKDEGEGVVEPGELVEGKGNADKAHR